MLIINIFHHISKIKVSIFYIYEILIFQQLMNIYLNLFI